MNSKALSSAYRRSTRRALLVTGVCIGFSGCLGNSGLFEADEHDDDGVFAYGDIELWIDGDEVDLTADRFQAEYADTYALEFHFHTFDDYWYMEGEEYVSVGTGLNLLPEISFEEVDGGHHLSIDEDSYDERDEPVEITIMVNNESVDPMEYVLAHEDEIVITVDTTA